LRKASKAPGEIVLVAPESASQGETTATRAVRARRDGAQEFSDDPTVEAAAWAAQHGPGTHPLWRAGGLEPEPAPAASLAVDESAVAAAKASLAVWVPADEGRVSRPSIPEVAVEPTRALRSSSNADSEAVTDTHYPSTRPSRARRVMPFAIVALIAAGVGAGAVGLRLGERSERAPVVVRTPPPPVPTAHAVEAPREPVAVVAPPETVVDASVPIEAHTIAPARRTSARASRVRHPESAPATATTSTTTAGQQTPPPSNPQPHTVFPSGL
jgi:hypothetical protein